ncbi:hypothetical protein Tco_1065180 [Tanacetum coccineum]
MKSRITPNPRHQPPEQSQKRGMEIGALEARHRLPLSSKDSNKTNLPHLGPGCGRRMVCSIGWEEKNKVHLHVLTAAIRVPTKRKPRCSHDSILIGARVLGKLRRTFGRVEDSEVKHYEDDLSQPWTYEERNPFTLVSGHFNFPQDKDALCTQDIRGKYAGIRYDHLKLFQAAAKTEGGHCNIGLHVTCSTSTLTGYGKLSSTNKTHQGSGGDTSYQAMVGESRRTLWKIPTANHGCGRSARMYKDLWINARYNPPRADQAFIRWKIPGEERRTEEPMIIEAEHRRELRYNRYLWAEDGGVLRSSYTDIAASGSGQKGNKKQDDPSLQHHSMIQWLKPFGREATLSLLVMIAQQKPRISQSRYDARPAAHGGALLKCPRGMPTCQTKEKRQAPKRNKVIPEEVEKLVDAGIMKEVHYHSWLSNPVMVKKHNGSWRMCVDFKDLNKACPQDGYPLPEGDRLESRVSLWIPF